MKSYSDHFFVPIGGLDGHAKIDLFGALDNAALALEQVAEVLELVVCCLDRKRCAVACAL